MSRVAFCMTEVSVYMSLDQVPCEDGTHYIRNHLAALAVFG